MRAGVKETAAVFITRTGIGILKIHGVKKKTNMSAKIAKNNLTMKVKQAAKTKIVKQVPLNTG